MARIPKYTVEAAGTNERQYAYTYASAKTKGLRLAKRAMKQHPLGGDGTYYVTDAISAGTDTFNVPRKSNPVARIGTKLTKVRIKVGKRTVNGMAKRVGGKVKVFVTPGVAKGLPKRYRKANPVTKFKAGDRVVDKDGFKGTVTKVTFHDKSHWYDVRFPGGYAVRYDSDLTKVATR